MARYWLYLNDEVAGPFAVEQLIRQRGFSRQTLVCVDDATGKPSHWISPAEIPELAHIFKAVDEQHAASPAPASPPKATSPRPAPVRAPRPYTPAVTLKAPARDSFSAWVWMLLAAALLGGGGFTWFQYMHRGDQSREQEQAQSLIENARLPASSLYSTLRQYIQEKEIKPKWEFEKTPEALYHVSLSWYLSDRQAGAQPLSLYAFEANTQAQTVRGLNTAAVKLLSEGFPAPPAPAHSKTASAPKKSPTELFPAALEIRREALEKGNFQAVWDSFSTRKKSEMAKGGISQDGFLRLQALTHRVDSPTSQTVLKTKAESDTEMLVLIKETQTGRPDVFVKQLWVFQDNDWKLDDEQKKSAESDTSPKSEVPGPRPETPDIAHKTSDAPAPASKPVPATLPGMSN